MHVIVLEEKSPKDPDSEKKVIKEGGKRKHFMNAGNNTVPIYICNISVLHLLGIFNMKFED